MRKEQARVYKSNYDEYIKVQRAIKAIDEKQVAKLKSKRRTFREKQKEITEARIALRVEKRNRNLLTAKQERIKAKQIAKAQKVSKRLKFQKNGGDIAFREILNEGNWQDNFVSSNVWKFRTRGKNLLVAFLDGSVYMYFGVAEKFLGLLNAGSKGKWVWRVLRRPQIGYMKLR